MLSFNTRIEGFEGVVRKLGATEEAINRELLRAMNEAVLDTETEVVLRTPVDTGRLRNSVQTEVRGTGLSTVGIVSSANVPYAPPVEEGTGPRDIVPRRASPKASLRFTVGGRTLFRKRVRHPGTRGAHMFRDGRAAAAPQVAARFRAAIARLKQRRG